MTDAERCPSTTMPRALWKPCGANRLLSSPARQAVARPRVSGPDEGAAAGCLSMTWLCVCACACDANTRDATISPRGWAHQQGCHRRDTASPSRRHHCGAARGGRNGGDSGRGGACSRSCSRLAATRCMRVTTTACHRSATPFASTTKPAPTPASNLRLMACCSGACRCCQCRPRLR